MSSAAHFTLFPTSIGTCGVAWRADVVIAVRLPDGRPATTYRHFAERRNATEGAPPKSIQQAISAMIALLQGKQTDLSFIECDFANIDPFAAKVYAATRDLSAGQTSTYGAIAAKTGEKNEARRVGQALGRNPVPIIVPCHRVLGSGGRLTGFSAPGGVEMKLRMLEIEGAVIGGGPGLFGNLPFSMKAQP